MKQLIFPALLSATLFLTACPKEPAATPEAAPEAAPTEAVPEAPSEEAAPVAEAEVGLAANPEEALARAREVTKALGTEMKKALVKAMKEGGPTAAITICNEMAPEVAARLATEKKVTVRRVSTKPRNPGNAPDAWEQKTLAAFGKPSTPGGKIEVQEHWEVVESGGKKQLRYARSILAGEVCLKCHGSNLEPALTAQIKKLYPTDSATGYSAGQLRGALSATVPLSGE